MSAPEKNSPIVPPPPDEPRPWKLFWIFFMIGAQSFGGGPSTIQMIRQALIYRHRWLTEMEYTRYWTLATLVPGINLLGFPIVVGRKLAGWRGIVAMLSGLLLPSVVITTLLTVGFTWLQSWPPFHSMLRGIIPATAGLMFVNTFQMGRPLFKESRREGWNSVARSLVFVVGAALLISYLKVGVWLVLLLAALAGAFALSPRRAVLTPPAPKGQKEEA